jgi:hypothetical protein
MSRPALPTRDTWRRSLGAAALAAGTGALPGGAAPGLPATLAWAGAATGTPTTGLAWALAIGLVAAALAWATVGLPCLPAAARPRAVMAAALLPALAWPGCGWAALLVPLWLAWRRPEPAVALPLAAATLATVVDARLTVPAGLALLAAAGRLLPSLDHRPANDNAVDQPGFRPSVELESALR